MYMLYVNIYIYVQDHYECATKVELLQLGSINNCVLQLIVSNIGLMLLDGEADLASSSA